MSDLSYFVLGSIALFSVLILLICKKTKHFFKNFFLSCLSGVGSLFLVNLLTDITAVSIPVNYISLAVGAFMGIPGVIGLVVSQILI